MNSVITGLLSLVGNLVPLAGGSTSTVGMVINTLTEVVPLVIKEYQDVAPFIKNIIAALKDDPAATQAQLDALDVLDKQVDDAFDAAWARVQEEDKS
jgi:hypothetical protein